jgi:vanillate O-demethylase ferredoxin subunit
MKNNQRWHTATVERIRDLSPTVREITLRPDEGATPWTVGSHLQVEVSIGDRSDIRTYSLVGLPDDVDGYRIAVKRAVPGRGGSRHMWRLAEGDSVSIAGPNNHFELSAGPPQSLLVAAGIGITPLLGMALTLAARNADCRMLYAARDDGELVYADRLREALGHRLATFAAARGERLDLDEQCRHLAAQGQLLVCGPIGLLNEAREVWARAGRPASLLRFETFGNSGARPNEAFWVRLPRHGLEFEVPPERSLLEVLESQGVEVLSDCKRGECGLCAVDIEQVQGTVDHRDVFFSPHEKLRNQRMCACVSRISGGGVVLDSAYRPD